MSAASPEEFSTATPRSGRPAKRAKASNATEKHGNEIEALFANPDRALEKTIGPKPKVLSAAPEIVTNVQGSSAGAGSGEFHVYKASRRREYERLRVMDEDVERERADKEWEERRNEARSKDEAKISKNRARREKQKARQAKIKGDGSAEPEANPTMNGAVKKKLVPSRAVDDSTEAEEVARVAGDAVEAAGLTFIEDD